MARKELEMGSYPLILPQYSKLSYFPSNDVFLQYSRLSSFWLQSIQVSTVLIFPLFNFKQYLYCATIRYMSIKIQQQDDAEIMQERRNPQQLSSLSAYNFPRSNTNEKSKSQKKLYCIIFGCLLVILYLFFNNKGNPSAQDLQLEQRIKSLTQKVTQLQKPTTKQADLQNQLKNIRVQENFNLVQLNNLKKQLQDHITEDKKIIHQQDKDNSKPKAETPKVEQPKPPQPEKKNPNNNPKNQYMTPDLQSVSQKRRQRGGSRQTPSGTVSQIKYLMKNKSGKTIDQVVYKDDSTRESRRKFQEQRVNFLSNKQSYQSITLSSYNNVIDETQLENQKRIEEEEYVRIQRIHNLNKYPKQLPMCIIAPGYNNNAKFRIEYNLNSIFQQNYTNYFVVIINDASNDNSDQVYRKYLDFYNINKDLYAYIENTDRKTALENIYLASHEYCSPDSIAINLDADDQFIGKNVLKIFNAGYQRLKAGVVYSNFYWYDQGANIMLGFTSEYTENDKKNNMYRQAPQRFSHLRSYRTELFLKIKAKDFQDEEGKFFTSAYDMAMYFPLMELSCGRVSKVQGFHYLYNINTGLNDYAVDRNKQVSIDNKVRRAAKYGCDQTFNKTMSLP